MRAITDQDGNLVKDKKALPENYFQIDGCRSEQPSASSLTSVMSESLDSLQSSEEDSVAEEIIYQKIQKSKKNNTDVDKRIRIQATAVKDKL